MSNNNMSYEDALSISRNYLKAKSEEIKTTKEEKKDQAYSNTMPSLLLLTKAYEFACQKGLENHTPGLLKIIMKVANDSAMGKDVKDPDESFSKEISEKRAGVTDEQTNSVIKRIAGLFTKNPENFKATKELINKKETDAPAVL